MMRWSGAGTAVMFGATALYTAFYAPLVLAHYSPPQNGVHKNWRQGDYYQSFTELSLHEVEGLDFSRHTIDRGSAVTVLAIHGGRIEPGVSALVTALTAQHFNLYEFRGHSRQRPQFDLHVTSTRFDDPIALDLTRRAEFAVAIHSFWEVESASGEPLSQGLPRMCIGGLNSWLQQRATQGLTAVLPAGTVIEPNCKKFPGAHPRNIVNLAQHHGLQLEFSIELIEMLLADQTLFDDVVTAIRQMLIPIDTPPSPSPGPSPKSCEGKLI